MPLYIVCQKSNDAIHKFIDNIPEKNNRDTFYNFIKSEHLFTCEEKKHKNFNIGRYRFQRFYARITGIDTYGKINVDDNAWTMLEKFRAMKKTWKKYEESKFNMNYGEMYDIYQKFYSERSYVVNRIEEMTTSETLLTDDGVYYIFL